MLTLMFPDGDSRIAKFLDERCDPQRARCIDGNVTSRSKCGGYCVCKLHPGYLTQSLTEQHHCVEKECAYYYIRSADEHKPDNAFKTIKNSIRQACDEVLSAARSVTGELDGLCVTSVKYGSSDDFVIFYAAIAQYDLQSLASQLRGQIGAAVEFKPLPGGFDTHMQLVMAK